MAVITLTQALVQTIGPNGVRWGQRRYDVTDGSDQTGNAQDRLGAPPRWSLSLAAPDGVPVEQAVLWEELVLSLRGRVNYLLAWDPKRPAPRGTMRGTMTLNGAHSAGAVSVAISAGAGQANATLLRGSPLQLGSGLGTSQLVRTIGDATANGSGNITVTVEPPLRIGFSGGAAVTWDKASTYFKATGGDTLEWSYMTRSIQQGHAIDLLERWN